MRARRALLYMPGDDLRKITKATTLNVDCICMDMEDGVALSRKSEARQTIVQALQALDFGRSEKLARINPVGSGLEDEDLAVVLPARPEGIVIPKVENSDQVRSVSQQIDLYERRAGWPIGETGLIVVVESARGILNLADIASASMRLQAIIFGAEDLANDLGAVRTPAGMEVFYARSAIVLHAVAHNLQSIDMVYVDFKDSEGLHSEALQGARMGFTGKQVIHPNQVPIVQAAFTPSEAAITYARRVLEAWHRHQAAGIGAFSLDGKMVDAPVVKAAEAVLVRAEAAGKLAPES